MLGKCRITTSIACVASSGIFRERPSKASSRATRLTCPIHLIDTLKILSLPSPGRVNSSSTCQQGDINNSTNFNTEGEISCYVYTDAAQWGTCYTGTGRQLAFGFPTLLKVVSVCFNFQHFWSSKLNLLIQNVNNSVSKNTCVTSWSRLDRRLDRR